MADSETEPRAARILKADAAAPVTTAAPLGLDGKEAERVLAEARAEAEALIATAKEDAERLRAQAAAEGRERGLQAVTELLVGARAAAAGARQHAEPELRALAVKIAGKLLGRELALRADAVTDVVAEALRLAGEPGALTVRVHPDDLAAVERGRPRLIERCRAGALINFRSDSQVGRGGCVIETELGVVDARLSTQLDAIERALRGSARREPE
jgi:type III secretion system HrpE/YscL family protein